MRAEKLVIRRSLATQDIFRKMSEKFFTYIVKTAFIGVQNNIWIENNCFGTVPRNQVFYWFLAECVRLVLPKLISTCTERFFEPKNFRFLNTPFNFPGINWNVFKGSLFLRGEKMKLSLQAFRVTFWKKTSFQTNAKTPLLQKLWKMCLTGALKTSF